MIGYIFLMICTILIGLAWIYRENILTSIEGGNLNRMARDLLGKKRAKEEEEEDNLPPLRPALQQQDEDNKLQVNAFEAMVLTRLEAIHNDLRLGFERAGIKLD